MLRPRPHFLVACARNSLSLYLSLSFSAHTLLSDQNERERERCRFFKGMTGTLAPFSYLVTHIHRGSSQMPGGICWWNFSQWHLQTFLTEEKHLCGVSLKICNKITSGTSFHSCFLGHHFWICLFHTPFNYLGIRLLFLCINISSSDLRNLYWTGLKHVSFIQTQLY